MSDDHVSELEPYRGPTFSVVKTTCVRCGVALWVPCHEWQADTPLPIRCDPCRALKEGRTDEFMPESEPTP